MKKVLVIAGLTASGKTSLSIDWAKKFNGEIINGDSQQVYRGLDIGTAKISKDEMENVPHHLIDILDYSERFHVKAFQELCREKINDITKRGLLPILVGGTGLYLKAALYDYQFEEETDQAEEYLDQSTEDLYQELLRLDPISCEKIHANNRVRIVRALNMAKQGQLKSARIASQKQEALYDVFWCVLAPNKEQIDQRIEQRVDMMFEVGLKKEVEKFFSEKECRKYQSFQAIGYKEWAPYFELNVDLATIKEKIVIHTRQFAKRQKTWFKNQLPSRFVDSLNNEDLDQVYQEVSQWLQGD